MTKRIFRSIFIVALSVLLACILLIVSVIFDYIIDSRRDRLKLQSELVASGFISAGESYLEDIKTDELRITHISQNGEVLYDSRTNAADMGNHLDRDEIKAAAKLGYGESSRYSDTLSEHFLYSAQRLPDGSILRLSLEQSGMWALFFEVIQLMCAIIIIAAVLSLVLASGLSKKIVKPLNSLNLDDPLSNCEYDEISPLLRRIASQQKKLKNQSIRLRRAKDEFDTVTSNMNEGLVLINNSGEILSLNRSAGKLFFTDERNIGDNIAPIAEKFGISDLVASALSGGRGEKIVELSGGDYQFDASPVMSDGVASGAVLLIFDVTEKARAEQLRREFTANVSHELKTPLHSISGYAELLANGMVKKEDTNSFSDKIYTEAQRMIRLIDDIIKLSSLDESQGEPLIEPCDLYALAKSAVEGLEPVAGSAGVNIILKGESAVINGVAQQLTAIIYNLCDNAIKYNRAGGSVEVEVNKTESAAILTVADTGIGIPAEHLTRIFERFYRVDKSHSKELGGTGLGLSIVKHAARLHGAEINLSSIENEGTTVTVNFPIKSEYSM